MIEQDNKNAVTVRGNDRPQIISHNRPRQVGFLFLRIGSNHENLQRLIPLPGRILGCHVRATLSMPVDYFCYRFLLASKMKTIFFIIASLIASWKIKRARASAPAPHFSGSFGGEGTGEKPKSWDKLTTQEKDDIQPLG